LIKKETLQHIRMISEGSCDWRLQWWKFSFESQE